MDEWEILEYLKGFTPLRAEIFYWRFIEKLTNREVGEKVSRNPESLGYHFREIRRDLK